LPSPARIRSTIATITDPPQDLKAMAVVHKALADPTRLRILQRLVEGDGTVSDLMRHVDLSQPLVSWHVRRLRAAGLVETRRSGFISPDQRSGIRAKVEPIALAMSRAGLTPNMLTLIGFGIASLGGLMAAAEWWLLAGIVATVGAGFDMFDGAVARATGQVSKLGAFMDSTFDRWGEGVVYVGIIIGSTRAGFDLGAWLAGAALVSAFMVSYTRAKSESLGFSSGTGMAAIGFAPREVRTVILGVALVGAGIFGVGADLFDLGNLILTTGLGLIAVLATITVIQRIRFVTSSRSSSASGSSLRNPQIQQTARHRNQGAHEHEQQQRHRTNARPLG